MIEARLSEHGEKFIAGTSRPTIADFKAFQAQIATLYNPVTPVPPPILNTLNEKIQASPQYAKWTKLMKVELFDYIMDRPPRPI